MSLPDLLHLADLALRGQSFPNLSEDLLREVVEASHSKAGVFRCPGGAGTVRWPRTLSEQVESATDGWSEVSFGESNSEWVLRLMQAERLDEATLAAVRLVLRASDLQTELKRARFDKRFHLWELEAIRAIATSIDGLDDPVNLAEELVAHLVALLGVRSAQLYLADNEEPVGRFGPPVLCPEEIKGAYKQAVFGEEVMAIPLTSEGGVLGVLVVGSKEARAGTEPFAPQDVRLLELFGLQVTVALEYARLARQALDRDRLQRELEVAATIQGHLLPGPLNDLPGFRVEARSMPTRDVAGDTYDLLTQSGDLVVTVTDVSGKGVGAGLIASGVQAGVRLLIPEDYRLEDLTERLNSFLCGATQDNRFATFAMARITNDGSVYAVNAGHCPILLRRSDGSVERISSSGLPLGIFDVGGYRTERRQLAPGELVVLYTDGFTEAEDDTEEEFGIDRIAEVIANAPWGAARAAAALYEAVEKFTRGRPLEDDATLVVVEWLGPTDRKE